MKARNLFDNIASFSELERVPRCGRQTRQTGSGEHGGQPGAHRLTIVNEVKRDLAFRPFSDIRLFPTVARFRYPVDLIEKS